MSGGEVHYDGSTDEGITAYNHMVRFRSSPKKLAEGQEKRAEVVSLEFLDASGARRRR